MVGSSLTALVEEIRTRGLSRNRHYHLMSQPPYREAMRLKRYLDGLAQEITRLSSQGPLPVRVSFHGAQRVTVRLRFSKLQATRCCYLSRDEFDVLCRLHPAVGRLLRSAGRAPTEHDLNTLGDD